MHNCNSSHYGGSIGINGGVGIASVLDYCENQPYLELYRVCCGFIVQGLLWVHCAGFVVGTKNCARFIVGSLCRDSC